MSTFLEAIENRRSIYALDKNIKVSKDEIVEAIQQAVKFSPSAFNSQTAHVLVLFGAESEKIWGEGGITETELRKVIPEGQDFAPTAQKLASFNAGVGTVLFYEDQDVVKGLQEKFALYADNFPVWSEHSTGITQFAVWTALSDIGIGASLQHYNPLIDEAVAAEFNVPKNWKLRAQMPFGNIAAPAGEKAFAPIEDRVKVIG
ncbi:nitroreductase family protein [Sporolactobacillus sp. CPB3-1]|uniref:Nitroreductase family protein n=1 Tax=Sporolactobacillus mangiferae TaxID=2940498 RepID=A0ABT0MA11_9BACL|nr:nitroreductase family protein [Sporolactobacillus mangiferae]MCL1631707.1 nitroreductase family protein [Sporolactobacillus mangiferae]